MRLGELTPTPLARMVWAGEGDSSGSGWVGSWWLCTTTR